MGAQVIGVFFTQLHVVSPSISEAMLPKTNKPMKAATKAVRAMSKSNIAKAMANGLELKQKVCTKMLNIISELATKEVKKNGLFAIPSLCRFKTRTKPATKAGQREIFGKVCMVKAKPARKIVKAYPVAALKKSI